MGVYEWAYILSTITAFFSFSVYGDNNDTMKTLCEKNSSLLHCILRSNLADAPRRRHIRSESRNQFTSGQSHQQTAADKAACKELREEFMYECALTSTYKVKESSLEFCHAYENVCFDIPENEPDQPTVAPRPTTAGKSELRQHRDYTQFCREYKQRYLYVCPDPLRFGQKAVIFCPLYAERCHMAPPEKPVVPTRVPSTGRSQSSAITRLCIQYRGFAAAYCQNIFMLQQPRYRDACEKYWRFCLSRG